jgi:hypothetical protein
MALPKQIRPEYNTTIPSSGKKIKYQPFTVREEKVLILAAESQEMDEISNAVANVLNNCISHPVDFKIDELAIFDIEYLFLKARSKSAGETIKVVIRDPDDESYSTEHEIDIDKIRVIKTKDHTNLIDLADDIKVKMKYPGLEFFTEGVKIDNIGDSLETVAKCISSIVVGEEVYNSADMTNEEVTEWLEGMTTEQFKKLMSFFETMPAMKHEIKLKNPNTGKDFSVTLQGLADFF